MDRTSVHKGVVHEIPGRAAGSPQSIHDFESVGAILARLAQPGPEPSRWDYMAVGLFSGVFLTTTLVLALEYFGR